MKAISIIVGETIIRERLAYVLDFLENHPLCPSEVKFEISEEMKMGGIEVFYGGNNGGGAVFIPTAMQFFSPEKLVAYQDMFVPSLKKGGMLYEFDLFETIFFHISRYEEVFCTGSRLDGHGRMKSSEMFLVKNNLEKQPIVDRLVFDFFEILGLEPKSRPAEFHLSHDIDMILKFPSGRKALKSFASMLLKQRSLMGFLKLIKQYFQFFTKKEKDPFDTYDWLFVKNTFKSKTVYVLPEGTVPKIEKHFKLDAPKLLEIIELAKSRNYRIGLHPSYNAGFDENLFLKEKDKIERLIGKKTERTRQHFLRWKFPQTPRIIEKSGLKTDSTLGFSDRIGFRCGTGYPYRLYDFEKERAFTFWELPMVVMDVGLLREHGNSKKVLNDFLTQNQKNTAITFNFHNSTFDSVYTDAEGLRKLYLSMAARQ